MSSSKKVKINVFFSQENCSTFANYWIGCKAGDRPVFMVKLFLEFAFRHKWISPGETVAYLIVRDKQVVEAQLKEMGVELNGLSGEVPICSG